MNNMPTTIKKRSDTVNKDIISANISENAVATKDELMAADNKVATISSQLEKTLNLLDNVIYYAQNNSGKNNNNNNGNNGSGGKNNNKKPNISTTQVGKEAAKILVEKTLEKVFSRVVGPAAGFIVDWLFHEPPADCTPDKNGKCTICGQIYG